MIALMALGNNEKLFHTLIIKLGGRMAQQPLFEFF